MLIFKRDGSKIYVAIPPEVMDPSTRRHESNLFEIRQEFSMDQNDIEDTLDRLRRIKSGSYRNSFNVDQLETLEMELRFLRTFTNFDGIPDECKTSLNLERLVSHLLEFVEDGTSSRFNYELNDSHLSEYMDFLCMNLNDATKYLDKPDPLFRRK
ncbi:hypothetical protein CQW23_25415 [Capsicum baccatum]|uniref:Uncharacterized protein n=1 Tax=Capsicum baccatum TaxID=33114 RepID=A0A2G2VKW1_CAPBA|nr:hypothetical protein CQW23_25415 [Capsicum baccatum]